MRELVPLRGTALCKKIYGGTETSVVGGIRVKRVKVDLYKIIELPVVPSPEYQFKLGDVVMSNSTGDEIEVNPGETVYLFKLENLMCVVDYHEQKG